jgi:RNase P/RNase MRP subunit POP5
MKPLIPSHKENKRYLLVHGNNLKENIEKAIIDFSGGQGMSKAGLVFISSDYARDSAIIGINREAVDMVRASLVVFPERMEVLKVSGTLKGLGRK